MMINGNEMTQEQLPLIEHTIDDSPITQRAFDGYVNATALCKASKKELKHYLENKSTDEFLTELSRSVGISTDQLGLLGESSI